MVNLTKKKNKLQFHTLKKNIFINNKRTHTKNLKLNRNLNEFFGISNPEKNG